jgi:hypothetical protein
MSYRIKWFANTSALVFALMLMASEASWAAPPTSDTSKATPADLAPTDIGQSLGVALPNVRTLGQRIGDARREFDPVALALASYELEAMEKLSGKTASLTANALAAEAIDLAKRRRVPEELTAVAIVLKGNSASSDLLAEAKKAAEPEETKGLHTLRVVNQTGWFVRVHVQGVHHGEVGPQQERTFHLSPQYHHMNSIHLDAIAFANGQEWVFKSFDHYSPNAEAFTWILVP